MYVVCAKSSTIWLYNTATYSRLDAVIEVDGMKDPSDIVACFVDRQLYVADWSSDSPYIWRVSAADRTSVKWLTTADTPDIEYIETLSMTSRRLLVTSRHSLHQYSTADRRATVVQLPENLQLCHGVETTRGTFVVGYRTRKWEYAVSRSTNDNKVN